MFAGLALFITIITFIAYELGHYLFLVMTGVASTRFRILDTIERKIYRFIGTDPSEEQDWRGYAVAMLIFNAIGLAVLLFLLFAQGWLILNPENFPGFSPALAFNTAVSFVTNTNWQAYSGEATASYLTQTAGLAVQNFLSAATGISVAIAVIRGMTRVETDRLGNFWVDLTRITLYVLVPLALILAIFLISQGVIQNYDPYVAAQALDPAAGVQTIPMGPVASQESIKELGTNGGGFFNANSAHPFENPTPLTNIVEIAAILVIAAYVAAFYFSAQ
ncbi:MAG: potassium-transporting ATPase subunit KdpA [Syntrophobacteraceae bacterium]|nr:potassium-transporting ATPase subunit KdpA [Syntrophobacteraceae bacterium]